MRIANHSPMKKLAPRPALPVRPREVWLSVMPPPIARRMSKRPISEPNQRSLPYASVQRRWAW